MDKQVDSNIVIEIIQEQLKEANYQIALLTAQLIKRENTERQNKKGYSKEVDV